MHSLIFDAGPIISITTNNLLWILDELKIKYGGKFYIPSQVKRELVDIPLETKKFKFEALEVLYTIKKGTLEIAENPEIYSLSTQLIELANNIFRAHGHWINIVHFGEMSMIAAADLLNADAVVIDERTTRLLLENPKKLKEILEGTLHTGIETNQENLSKFSALTGRIKPIRSVELVTVAFELGILDRYLPETKDAKKTLLESVLWGVKLNGCSVSKEEIAEILKMESKRF